MDKLAEIIDHKRSELEALLPRAEKLRYAAASRNDFRSLHTALFHRDDPEPRLALIAEVKKASPSAGTISENFDPVAVARKYEESGADAISVLTDEKFFQGHLSFLANIRKEVSLPLLRKDFIIHEAQIYEAVVAGADAILLIVAALEQKTLQHLLDTAHTYQLEVLVEVHNLEELERALEAGSRIVGINNRNLKTFEVDLRTTEKLSEEVDKEVILVSESGIVTAEDARQVRDAGADAILVGESLMRSDDVPALVRAFTGA